MYSLCLQLQRTPITAVAPCRCRRSTGGLRVQVAAPNGGKHEGTGTGVPSGGRRSGRTNVNKAHLRPPLEHVDRKNGSVPSTADGATTVSITTIEAPREPREDTKQVLTSPAMVTEPSNAVTTTIAANERQGGAKTESKRGFDPEKIAPSAGGIADQGPTAAVPTSDRFPFQDFPRQPEAGTSPAKPTPGARTSSTTALEEDPVVATVESSLTVGEQAVEDGASLLPENRWPAMLDARWAEVEFVLCRAVESEESLSYTAEAAAAGLIFLEKLEKKAQVTITCPSVG